MYLLINDMDFCVRQSCNKITIPFHAGFSILMFALAFFGIIQTETEFKPILQAQ